MSMQMTMTGLPELDLAFVTFEKRTVNTWIRRALNAVVIMVEKGYKALCPVESGAMRDATVRRNPKGMKRGTFGRALIIDREKLFKLHTKRGGGDLWYKRRGKKSIERFFYPAVVELGDKVTPAKRPLRAALYGNENHVRDEFAKNIRAAIAEANRARNTPSLEAKTEMAWALDLNQGVGLGT